MTKTENTDNRTPAQIEKDRADRENKANKFKQRHEDKLADDTSPEQLRKDGGDVHPQTPVVPSQPEPNVNPEYQDTRYQTGKE